MHRMHRGSLGVVAAGIVVGSAALVGVPHTASAGGDAAKAWSFAAYGDSPYGTSNADTSQYDATPAFISSINADPDVSLVTHVGDIHSGKQYCTESYDRSIAALWTRFDDSLVYTPGDNEWSDCHKAAEGGHVSVGGRQVDYAGGDPVENLALVRSIFFPTAGQTLGGGNLHVQSQAKQYDSSHPEDAAYVENVMWQRKGVVFVTVNIPGGSNNDADGWFGAPVTERQTAEIRTRAAADLRWIDAAFARANDEGSSAVVVISQADMWDGEKGPGHLTNYEPFVRSLAEHTTALGKPVLMFNGDSHAYRSDNPLSQSAPCQGESGPCASDYVNHPGYDVPNFHRIVVHGSTFPLEWLKVTVSSRPATTGVDTFGPFSWERHTS